MTAPLPYMAGPPLPSYRIWQVKRELGAEAAAWLQSPHASAKADDATETRVREW